MSAENFFAPLPHPVLPVLATLRAQVLARSTTRCPKWKFRLADDLVVQIQPRPVVVISPAARAHGMRQRSLLFHGLAIHGTAITETDFTNWRQGTALWQILFELFAHQDDDDPHWSFRAKRAQRRRDLENDSIAWRDRVRSLLTSERFAVLNVDLMFGAHCLFCGKALIDPVSMARFIGPECFGSGSLTVPGLFRLDEKGEA